MRQRTFFLSFLASLLPGSCIALLPISCIALADFCLRKYPQTFGMVRSTELAQTSRSPRGTPSPRRVRATSKHPSRERSFATWPFYVLLHWVAMKSPARTCQFGLVKLMGRLTLTFRALKAVYFFAARASSIGATGIGAGAMSPGFVRFGREPNQLF